MTIYHEDDQTTIHHGDCIEIMRNMPDNSVHAIVTDPPYGLGFMGAAWDALPPGKDWAEECLRVLKPGGHLLAFGGTRTWHRLAVAIEDAGFEIRDSVMWLYGSGFPKSHDVGKAIDKAAGHVRGSAPDFRNGPNTNPATKGTGAYGGGYGIKDGTDTGPATPEAAQWDGWGTALKPATEPVVWARKPFNLVPLNSEVNRLHHLIGGLVWLSLSPAKRAELTSTSNPVEQHGATCVSALVSAAMDTSRAESAKTDTFNSQAAASTYWSIASSWSAILDALSAQTRTSTTATKSSTITGLKTLNSLLGPITSQTTMPACECLTGGPRSTAQNAESSSSDAWMNWLDTLSASVPETATEGIALAAASALASIAEELSAGQEAERTAGESATTRAAASSGALTEPIVMARKPFKGTVASNVLEHGTGAINIDATRIEGAPRTTHANGNKKTSTNGYEGGWNQTDTQPGPSGRWPANVILDEHTAELLDEQSGVLKSGAHKAGQPRNAKSKSSYVLNNTTTYEDNGSEGGASRFFYVAKAPKRERPEVNGVKHTTVKPLTLMRYLVRMVTPPNGIVLDPFAGSGTTIEAALLEGFQSIGIELTDEYLPLIQQRIQRQGVTK